MQKPFGKVKNGNMSEGEEEAGVESEKAKRSVTFSRNQRH
jgi:hypothetical protein